MAKQKRPWAKSGIGCIHVVLVLLYLGPVVEYLEGFVGVQGSAVMAPGSARLDVPVRASLGLQGRVGNVHLLLAARGGYDDLRLGPGSKPTVEATLAVGLWHFEEMFSRFTRQR